MVHDVLFAREESDVHALPTYSSLSEHSGMMTAHIILMIIAWVFTLPVGVVLSIAGHRYAAVTRSIFLALSGFGLIFGIIANSKTEALYRSNVHHTIGWIATSMVAVYALIDVILRLTKRFRTKYPEALPSVRTLAGNETHQFQHNMYRRWSGINSQFSESSPTNGCNEVSHSSSRYSDGDHERSGSDSDDDGEDVGDNGYKSLFSGRPNLLQKDFVRKGLRFRISGSASSTLFKVVENIYRTIDLTVLVFGYVTLVTGGVTYTGIFRGSHIYNGLAHFIKGGIFFWYGLLTLGRWLGCFSNVGWSWNVKPSANKTVLAASVPSAEFVESFVIFLYGGTNMFLEHLAGWGKAWTASDMEHISISVMFFGGGLCGMLVESETIRNLLNKRVEGMAKHNDNNPTQSDSQRLPKTSSPITNAMPALVIFLVGIVMSSHHQTSATSTTIHKQWGMLLAGFSVMRLLTYIVMHISPITSVYPSRPPTEIVASFCLISGGLVFMASTKDIVQAIEENGLMAMFVFTIAMGLTAFVMAWEIAVLSLKGWAERSEARRRSNMEETERIHVPVR